VVPVTPTLGIVEEVKLSNDDVGWTAALTFANRWETGSANLNFSHGVQGAYGQSGTVQRTSLTAELRRRFSYELSGGLGVGYYQNSSHADQFAHQAIDETTYRVAPSLRYELSRNVILEGSYDFALVQFHQSGTESQRNKIFVSLTLLQPLFE
jgi:hypothetical protein